MQTQTIGAYFRQFRQSRGLSLEAASANTGCSPAALSRFERGQNDLNVATVGRLLTNLRLAVQDLMWFDTTRTDLLDITDYYAFLAGDTAKLRAKAAAYSRTHKDAWPLNDLVVLLLTVGQWPLDANRRLSHAQEARLQQVLIPFPGWGYEVQSLALAAGLQFASHELMANLTAQFIAYADGFDEGNAGDSVITGTDYAHLLLHLISHREFALVDALLPATLRYHQLRLDHRPVNPVVVYEVNAAPLIQLAQLEADALRNPGAAPDAAVAQLIAQVQTLGAKTLVAYMRRMWAVAQTGVTPWHDPTLAAAKAPALLPEDWQFNGPTIKAIRQYYHLSLEQTAVTWSVATQSRFENGLTQLGFNAARTLAEALLLNPVIFYLDLYPMPSATLATALAAHPGPDRVAGVTAALADALATVPTAPRGAALLAADLEVRAIQLLEGEGIADDVIDQHINRAAVRERALAGLHQLERVEFSDLNSILTVADVLRFSPEEMLDIWRWLFAHATFDLTQSQQIADLFTDMVITLANEADVAHIRQLQHAAGNLLHHPVWISYAATTTLAETLVALYVAPDRADATWAALERQRAAMRRFGEPSDPTGGWIGDEADRVMATVPAAFAAWQASRA
ncbi:helix-turn-helix domain-containing protein [Lacticaseibacillus kribbianus]|uniref:helix-turn-helix domain-containing protein n=1 Tax=Lacticaseibacillus kribbianus TaxID=2926292 RepID=UPI001CD61458|nr:helix-turn-helix transcriptional regulator [Lacticaseibacillus kribbianus]